jgi:hypothetical protein
MRRAAARALVGTGALLVGLGGCDSQPSLEDRITPLEIRGTWEPADESYAGRTLQILEDGLVFQTGEGDMDFDLHMIRAVSSRPVLEGTATAFDIEYTVEETIFTFSFTYMPVQDAIYFKNQPQIRWDRSEEEA